MVTEYPIQLHGTPTKGTWTVSSHLEAAPGCSSLGVIAELPISRPLPTQSGLRGDVS